MVNTKIKPIPMLPMSTLMFMLIVIAFGFAMLALFVNPITMLFFNTFNPRFAASLAHNSFFCGERLKAFYTKLALKWPYQWSKWWITSERLESLNDHQQKEYYLTVNNSDDILWSLRPQVWAEVVTDKASKPHLTDEITKKLKERDDLFRALLDVVLEKQQSNKLLQYYLDAGTLPKSQMTTLVDYVCLEGTDHFLGCITDELSGYVRRCGISKDLFNKLRNSKTVSESAIDVVEESFICFTQRTMARRIRKQNEKKETFDGYKAWYAFCRSVSDIRVDAQKEMNTDQYKIFHEYGHKLDADAIVHLLWFGKKEMAEWIFSYEPKFGIQDDKIKLVLDRHAYLKPLLKDVIERTEKFLCHDIIEGECLSVERVNQMFDCPAAADMVENYITKHELPPEAQMRIFELPNAKEILEFYADLSEMGKDYRLTPAVQKKAIEKGFVVKHAKVYTAEEMAEMGLPLNKEDEEDNTSCH